MTEQKLNRRQWMAKMTAIAGAAIAAPVLSGAPDTSGCTDCGRCMPCRYGVDIPAVLRFHAEAIKNGLVPDPSLPVESAAYRKASQRYLGNTAAPSPIRIRLTGASDAGIVSSHALKTYS